MCAKKCVTDKCVILLKLFGKQLFSTVGRRHAHSHMHTQKWKDVSPPYFVLHRQLRFLVIVQAFDNTDSMIRSGYYTEKRNLKEKKNE